MSGRRLRRSTSAQRDLRAILQSSIESWGQERSDAYVASLAETLERLALVPGLGRRRDEVGPGFRSHPVGVHVVLYRAAEDEVVVLRIVHGRMEALTVPGG
ncbi:MAG: type II toxin-antitoxin system RelE/ParE family toxin [Chloroflexia bacterium]|nr:type II toxin-antitoxin system RelE/ParE family toxin [Chloroflexia bacterium]